MPLFRYRARTHSWNIGQTSSQSLAEACEWEPGRRRFYNHVCCLRLTRLEESPMMLTSPTLLCYGASPGQTGREGTTSFHDGRTVWYLHYVADWQYRVYQRERHRFSIPQVVLIWMIFCQWRFKQYRIMFLYSIVYCLRLVFKHIFFEGVILCNTNRLQRLDCSYHFFARTIACV